MSTGCGAPAGGVVAPGAAASGETVISGTVTRAGDGVGDAYVRLLDSTGEFTAEVPTGPDGGFRFYARPGSWTLRTLAPKAAPVDVVVEATAGAVTQVQVAVTAA